MIKLQVEDFYGVKIADHTVKCEYAERCRHIKEYLEGNRNE